MIDPLSYFPDKIDPLGYWSDVSISQEDIMNQYNSYIALGTQEGYTAAYDLINQSAIFGWFANYLNAIENRICSLQDYLTNQNFTHPDQNLYTTAEPTQFSDITSTRALAVNDVWITDTDFS